MPTVLSLLSTTVKAAFYPAFLATPEQLVEPKLELLASVK
jgi:hypothetical protein